MPLPYNAATWATDDHDSVSLRLRGPWYGPAKAGHYVRNLMIVSEV